MKTGLISKLFCVPFAIIAACVVMAGQARAQLVYDDGPINGTINAWIISTTGSSLAVSDSFTLSNPTTLASAQAGLWVASGATPTSLQWSIGTTPFASNISSGSASLNNTFFGLASVSGYSIYESDFSITGSLAAGTYYFTLTNAVASNPGFVGWDQNNGPSSYYQTTDGSTSAIYGAESFQLYSVPVPEPTIKTMFAVFAALGLLMVRLRSKASVAR